MAWRAGRPVAAPTSASYRHRRFITREIAVARPAKKTAVPETDANDIPRPPQPQRYKASKEEMLKLYREMLLIRRFEERAGQLYGLGLIGGFCHLYIGQEAVAVGLQSAMTV